MLLHVQNFYNKRKKVITNLQNQLNLIKQKEDKLKFSREKIENQIAVLQKELSLSEEEVDSLIKEGSISNNKTNSSKETESEEN